MGWVMFAVTKALGEPCSDASALPARALTNKASDKVLVAAIARGDHYAMRLLYGRHSVRVYRFAMRIVADRSVAEDVVSEVFLDVWRRAQTFEGRAEVSTWLLGITRLKALAIIRRRPLETWDDDALMEFEDATDDPETALQKKQRGSCLSQLLAKLSPAHREIIDLVYYHEKRVDEVAEIIGVPGATVKTRMYYARKHLMKLLTEAGLAKEVSLMSSSPRSAIELRPANG